VPGTLSSMGLGLLPLGKFCQISACPTEKWYKHSPILSMPAHRTHVYVWSGVYGILEGCRRVFVLPTDFFDRGEFTYAQCWDIMLVAV
jgi:hypothetical protein